MHIVKSISILKESFLLAVSSITANKLRTFLSLFGITIGIFAIISVSTVIDSLQKNVQASIATLGENTLYIDKWEWVGGMDYPWWEYMKRPQPTADEAEKLQSMSKTAQSISFVASLSFPVKYGKRTTKEASLSAVTYPYKEVRTFDIEKGRYFTEKEAANGTSLAIMGVNVVRDLFNGAPPIGKKISVGSQKATVIGVFKKVGDQPFGNSSLDDEIIVPYPFAKKLVNFDNYNGNLNIVIKGRDNVATSELTDEITMLLRKIRKIPPLKKNDFSINEMATIAQSTEGIFSSINLAGMLIGGLSIIVGGFGIANIMFVSVKERTHIIGIQKALGAKKAFILLEFVYESVILAIVGGVIGLILVFMGTFLFNQVFDSFQISLSIGNIVKGILISGVIGFLSGLLPAINASKLDPVVAINSK